MTQTQWVPAENAVVRECVEVYNETRGVMIPIDETETLAIMRAGGYTVGTEKVAIPFWGTHPYASAARTN